jgi:hypothetical protein
MKCDEPKVYKVYTTRNDGAFGFCEGADPTDIELEHETVCLKSDVDKVIAKLKENLESVQASADTAWNYPMESSNAPLREGAKVRKWSDNEWHEPTVDYLELEDV